MYMAENTEGYANIQSTARIKENDYIISCNDLTKSYGKAAPALYSINLNVLKGRIIGLLGPNGSGKTTFIKILNGLLQPSHGDVMINGMPIGPETKAVVSYLPDKTYLNGSLTVMKAIEYFEDFYKDFDRNRAITLLNDLKISSTSIIKTLSKGTQEKLQLILVMSRNADLFLLDEPIAGVDPAARDYIIRTIIENRPKSSSVLISTHLIRDIEPVLDDYIFLFNGQIYEYDRVSNIKSQTGKTLDDHFKEVFRC